MSTGVDHLNQPPEWGAAMAHCSRDEQYSLNTGASGAERLRLLDEVYGPRTRWFLKHAGLAPRMQAADVGCGIGTVACWMAAEVGNEGRAIAIDFSADQIQQARQAAESQGLQNLSFVTASAYETGLPRASLDLVFCRALLAHLKSPSAAIVEMAALLKPGGILVCEEPDYSGARTYPPTGCYSNAMEYLLVRGVDPIMGLKLPDLCQKNGLSVSAIELNQPAILEGRLKQYWELTVREFAPRLIEMSCYTQEHMDEHLRELRSISGDSSTLVMLPPMVQISAVKPR